MGLGDFLFGEDGTGEQIIDTTPGQFTNLRDPFTRSLTGLINSGGGQGFQGDLTAGLSDEQKKLLGQINAQAGGTNGLQGQGRSLLSQTLDGRFLDPKSNPFLQGTIDAANRGAIRNFNEITDPRLRSAFTRSGQTIQPGGSSPFDKALGQSQADVFNTLSDNATQIASANFQAERGRQQAGIGQAEAITQQDFNKSIQALQANELPRLIKDLGIQRGLAEFQNKVNTLIQSLQLAGNASQARPQKLAGTPATPGFISDLAGGAKDIASIIDLF